MTELDKINNEIIKSLEDKVKLLQEQIKILIKENLTLKSK